MDFADFDTKVPSNEGRPMTVRLPNGDAIFDDAGNPVTITLLGSDSDKVTAIRDAMIDKRMKTGRVVTSAHDGEMTAIDFAAKCTVAWSGIKVDGVMVEYNYQNAVAFYKRFPWVREQADIFTGSRSNFFLKPSTI